MERNIRDSKNKKNTENTNKRYTSPRPAASAAETDEEWERRREARRRRRLLQRKRERRKKLMILAGAAVVSVAVIAGGIRGITGFISSRNNDSAQKTTADNKNPEGTGTGETEETKETQSKGADVLAEAALKAAQYDYDGAIELLKGDSSYSSSDKMQKAVKDYEATKATCTSWSLEEVTHVFYHILIKDTSKAFDGDYKEADYNQVMTTIDEFNKITQTMYDEGYVMVSIKDMAKADDQGNITPGEILLPPGKIPFVLSQDDVCYYHYMDGDGFASKLVVDDEGKVRNEYIEDDGTVSVGDYDMVPLIDRFVEAHPDFSYRGAKGIVALTGYNGILGYRTDSSYETRPADLDENKVEWLNNHPDFNIETERAEAKKVADAMKAEGWLFASHTWGHIRIGDASLESIQKDTEKWLSYVAPLVGGTDMIIFAHGQDLADWHDYSSDNAKFAYLKSQGFNFFCNVDSSQYFLQIRDNYVRQGRRNLDGYRLWNDVHGEKNRTSDLFDATQILDPARTDMPPL
mgnify:CR=1 FL=1